MGDRWIVNMTHYLDPRGQPIEADTPARRLADYFGSIVSAVTPQEWGVPTDSGVACRRRPRRKPCPGRIFAVLYPESKEIHWHCPCCNDQGIISGWEKTPWGNARAASSE